MQSYSIINTQYGRTLVATKNDILISFLFLAGDEPKMMQLFYAKFPSSQESDVKHFNDIVQNVLNGMPVKFELSGTAFQKSVWGELLQTRKTISYQELAKRIGNPKAVRAVANAVAQNLLHFLVPCHLVIRTSGDIGKYAGGANLKKQLIANLP
jgi:O-6-methylguanine DNA methyltransferase